jgi:hypothetical protein
MQHLLQRVALAEGSRAHLRRAIGAEDQNAVACPRKPSSKVEQEADGGGVGPLHVVQDQRQRMLLCYVAQHAGALFKQKALLQVVGAAPGPFGKDAEGIEPAIPAWCRVREAREQGIAVQERAD